jgi:bacteriophage N4 adsorption protein B
VASWILTLSVPVAFYLILSGLDDLFVDLVWVWSVIRGVVATPEPDVLSALPEKRIAIFVPLWHEHEVIERMLLYNGSAVHYSDYEFFVGVYPNDELTIQAVTRAAESLSNVTPCIVRHPGPTSKADCLNAIYQGMLDFEEETGRQFSIIITHDAEDIIHPQALRWTNYWAGNYDFIQIPVLALKTPLFALTHGIYCDEFAELHGRDMIVRAAHRAFIPSAGVGTGYSREALNALAGSNNGQIFVPECLTEDYENGLRLHLMGFRQIFVPIAQSVEDGFVATREFFPQSFWTAVKQRTRWVTGISLQSWQRNGWPGGWRVRYWLWRDRKGLIGAPLGLLTNVLFVLGCTMHIWREPIPGPVVALFAATTLLGASRIATRMWFVSRVYGIRMALLVPPRVLWGNAINGIATVRAQYRFTRSVMTGSVLSWSKTTHEYPASGLLRGSSRKLGDILVALHGVARSKIDVALRVKPDCVRLGEYLLDHCVITEEQLYAALALQQQLPLAPQEQQRIPNRVRRALPSYLMHRWNVLPFAIDETGMHVCSPEAPTEELTRLLKAHTGMPLRFYLATPSRYLEMVEEPSVRTAASAAGR